MNDYDLLDIVMEHDEEIAYEGILAVSSIAVGSLVSVSLIMSKIKKYNDDRKLRSIKWSEFNRDIKSCVAARMDSRIEKVLDSYQKNYLAYAMKAPAYWKKILQLWDKRNSISIDEIEKLKSLINAEANKVQKRNKEFIEILEKIGTPNYDITDKEKVIGCLEKHITVQNKIDDIWYEDTCGTTNIGHADSAWNKLPGGLSTKTDDQYNDKKEESFDELLVDFISLGNDVTKLASKIVGTYIQVQFKGKPAVESFIDENFDDCESAMEKLSKLDRDKLPDKAFGLPKQRKYPLYVDGDDSHLKNAIAMFHWCKEEDRKELATNIVKCIKATKSTVKIGSLNMICKYTNVPEEMIRKEEKKPRQKKASRTAKEGALTNGIDMNQHYEGVLTKAAMEEVIESFIDSCNGYMITE